MFWVVKPHARRDHIQCCASWHPHNTCALFFFVFAMRRVRGPPYGSIWMWFLLSLIHLVSKAHATANQINKYTHASSSMTGALVISNGPLPRIFVLTSRPGCAGIAGSSHAESLFWMLYTRHRRETVSMQHERTTTDNRGLHGMSNASGRWNAVQPNNLYLHIHK